MKIILSKGVVDELCVDLDAYQRLRLRKNFEFLEISLLQKANSLLIIQFLEFFLGKRHQIVSKRKQQAKKSTTPYSQHFLVITKCQQSS